MISYYISLILTFLMLLALPKEAYLGNQTIVIIMMILYSSLFLLYTTQKGKEFIQKKFSNPFLASLLLLVLINLFFIAVKGSFSIIFLGKSILAFLIPSILVYSYQKRFKRIPPPGYYYYFTGLFNNIFKDFKFAFGKPERPGNLQWRL